MGVVTYVGSTNRQVANGNGFTEVTTGVNYTFPDVVCAGLLASDPSWWVAGDQHTQTLTPQPNNSLVSVTQAYTVQPLVQICLADATAAAFTVTLPNAATQSGRVIAIKAINTNTNQVTVATAGGLIDGASTISLGPQASGATYLAVTFVCDGSSWRVA